MILDNQKIHVILALPVVHHNSRYDLIQAISLPVPVSNVSLSSSHKLEFKYSIIPLSKLNVTVPHLSDIKRIKIDIWHHAEISEQILTSLNASIQKMKLLPPLVKVSLAYVLSKLNKVSPDKKEFSVDWANSSPFQIAGFSVFSISGLLVIVVMIVLIQACRDKLFCIKQCALPWSG